MKILKDMAFVVPKFIERQPKIVGPFTFRQFILVGMAGAVCFVFYLVLPVYIFLAASFLLMAGTMFLVFGKIKGLPIPILIKNFFVFLVTSKVYLWKKGTASQEIIKIEKAVEPEEKKRLSVLNIAEKSRLKKISAEIEAGQR